jgi:arylsulfatase A-like enzyme
VRPLERLGSWLAGATCVLATGCARPTPPNVVLIVLDTVRADHVSCYGYARRTTPTLDALATRADRYDVARATAPWTLPSHASLFTGRFPFQHGADARRKGDWIEDAAPLPPEELTLAEVLADAGYRTGAFVANTIYVSPRLGLDQGFQEFQAERVSGQTLSARALEWLDASPSDAPVFLFLNYMDAHRPDNTAPLGEARDADLPAPPPEGVTGERYLDRLYEQLIDREAAPDPDLVQKAIDAYDRGIANADDGLRVLLEGLERRGRLDGAWILVTSDHGEYFGEHELIEHSKDVYEPALRVPLIVKRPGQSAGRIVEEPVSLADVPRLVLAELPSSIAGSYTDEFPGSPGVGGLFAELRYTRPKDLARTGGQRFLRERTALYEKRFKLIRSSDGAHELYDLAADPEERHDLYAEQPEAALRLMESIETLQARADGPRGIAEARAPTEAEQAELEALGYAGNGGD